MRQAVLLVSNENKDPIELMITIFDNGDIDFHNGYKPDVVATAFWDALAATRLTRCPACGK